tara:strand:- start:25933 stop:26580 length:648 start_codon:yes stop_codon:yes gene_type:complete
MMAYKGIRHRNLIIVGAGKTIVDNDSKLKDFIVDNDCKVIGINYMTNFCHPDYHLWTNRQRLKAFGQCIDAAKSRLMFNYRMPKDIIRRFHKGPYIKVVYSDDDRFAERFAIREDHIKGRFRTAGVLAIAIAHLMEAENIWVAGMDGYTLHAHDDVQSGKATQHCYGTGHTDDVSWEDGAAKDAAVQSCLDNLSKYVSFKIITPTKFENHYAGIL